MAMIPENTNEDRPGYFYVIPKRGNDWEVWMWTGHKWYEPGEAEPRDPPHWRHRIPQAPHPDDVPGQ